jgi:hypothetical protein
MYVLDSLPIHSDVILNTRNTRRLLAKPRETKGRPRNAELMPLVSRSVERHPSRVASCEVRSTRVTINRNSRRGRCVIATVLTSVTACRGAPNERRGYCTHVLRVEEREKDIATQRIDRGYRSRRE